MRAAGALALVLTLVAGPVGAEAPKRSARPEARGAAQPADAAAEAAPGAAIRVVVRPEPRAGAPLLASDGSITRLAVVRAALPQPRPAGLSPPVPLALPPPERQGAAPGQVCGSPLIRGTAEASFGEARGCGIGAPVRVRALAGVPLSAPSLMDCGTAEALLAWTARAREVVGGRHGGLARIDVMGDYACRPRNNQAGERLSEHGHGRAIDVGGITFADGASLTVLGDWPDRTLQALHEAACGPFSTVLGPAANAQHRNHFHFDTAPGRGPYCR